jgi:hypothetical protein
MQSLTRTTLSSSANFEQPPDYSATYTDTGFAFELTDEAFNRWWSASILPEDAAEFVHLHHGTMDSARFVCALEYLTTVQSGRWSADTLVKAYCLAKNIPEDLRDATTAQNTQYLYKEDATQFLLERVRYRSRKIAEERIASLTTTKIEELYQRSKYLDGKEQLDAERLALEAGNKFLANQARERGAENERRNRRAMQQALERSRQAEYDVARVPSLPEAKNFIAMLMEAHGAEAMADMVASLLPKELNADSSHS